MKPGLFSLNRNCSFLQVFLILFLIGLMAYFFYYFVIFCPDCLCLPVNFSVLWLSFENSCLLTASTVSVNSFGCGGDKIPKRDVPM